MDSGDHLDHLHIYTSGAASGEHGPTMDYHTDQGLMVAFAPALLVTEGGATATAEGDFWIKQADGQ